MGLPAPRSSGTLASPFKRRRNAAAISRQGTPDHGIGTSDIVQACISVLADIISEDCRYRVRRTRLLAPPNALQAICLDVALAIIEAHPHPQTLSAVALAVIPAFHIFDSGLYPRLLAFFENGIMRGMLQQLQRAQGASEIFSRVHEGELPDKLKDYPADAYVHRLYPRKRKRREYDLTHRCDPSRPRSG